MSIELLKMISLTLFIVAGIFFVAAVIMFFLMHIPQVVGDISGSTARKSIEGIRKQNEESGGKACKPSPVNKERGRITDKITPPGKLEKQPEKHQEAEAENRWLNTAQLQQFADETTALDMAPGKTTVLEQAGETTVPDQGEQKPQYSVDYEIGFSGSSEIIE